MCVGAIIGVWRRSEDSFVESALSSCLPMVYSGLAQELRSQGGVLPTVLSGPRLYFLTASFVTPSDLLPSDLHDYQAACRDVF